MRQKPPGLSDHGSRQQKLPVVIILSVATKIAYVVPMASNKLYEGAACLYIRYFYGDRHAQSAYLLEILQSTIRLHMQLGLVDQ